MVGRLAFVTQLGTSWLRRAIGANLGRYYCSAPASLEPPACVANDLNPLGLSRRKRDVLRLTILRLKLHARINLSRRFYEITA